MGRHVNSARAAALRRAQRRGVFFQPEEAERLAVLQTYRQRPTRIALLRDLISDAERAMFAERQAKMEAAGIIKAASQA